MKDSFYDGKTGLTRFGGLSLLQSFCKFHQDSSLSLRVTLRCVILSETKHPWVFKQRHLQYFLRFLPRGNIKISR